MSTILFQRADGKPAGEAVTLPRGRRRLSALMRAHADRSRPHIVSVHRRQGTARAEPLGVTDMSVRLRRHWSRTLVGPRDTVIVTYLPAGGGGASASGSSGAGKGASIGLVVAAVALAAIAPYATPFIAAGLGVSASVAGTIWAAGSALALAGGGYLLSRATQAKANKATEDRPVYGVGGGGNLPRSGDRIPVIYGRCWTSPDLSQPDYSIYEGDDQVLYKRLTIGCGRYALKSVRVSGVTMWTAEGGLTPPFAGAADPQLIQPGGTSSLVPGSVASVAAVGSNELPRATAFPNWAGPFDFGPGAAAQTRIQIDFTLPQGCYAVPDGGKFEGKQYAALWGILVEYAPCDDDGEPTGSWSTLLNETGEVLSTRAMRFTRFVDIASGRYTFRARNVGAAEEIAHSSGLFNAKITNTVIWEGLRSHIPQTATRPGITELALKIRSGKALGVTSYGDVEVEVQRILPVWYGAGPGWIEEETSKSVWAAADILRDSSHGAGIGDGAIDLARLKHYAETLTEYDEFNGVIRGPVSVHEALTTVLGTMRASPLRLGSTWTIVRDEPRAVRKHVITRRQILRDSTGQVFNLDLSDGSADVIVEWYAEGDPKRLRSHRVTIGTQTSVPRRMQATGATSAAHAIHLATWAAATAYYRRERRSLSLELAGRLVLPNDLALIDAWYFDRIETAGIAAERIDRDAGVFAFTLDSEIAIAEGSYGLLRARDGREWGPVALTQSGGVVQFDADDVALAETQSGLDLEEVLATAMQAMTTLVVGTLEEVQGAWLVRSVQFNGDDAQIEAVFDAPQVWSALAEPIVVPPPPPSSGLENAATIAVPWIAAKPVQRNGAMFMDWTLGRSRDAGATYVVLVSYDGWTTSEEAYRGPAIDGTYPLREVDTTVYVRAYALSESGVRGAFVSTQFSAVPAIIDLGNAAPGTLPYRAFLDGMEPVALVAELPDLSGYQGPQFAVRVSDRTMHKVSDDGLSWEPIAAQDYVAGSIVAGSLAVGAVDATAIDVENLSAISAQLGDILGGSLNINNRFMVAADGTVTLLSAATGARLVISNSLIEVFDGAGTRRVRMGVWP
ncbi:MAG: hypothetical protein DI527_01065 [Chelatococcus sp.]|nr:MAG: hypothetical protein DI527_01065 [Chelatococcus sp.]